MFLTSTTINELRKAAQDCGFEPAPTDNANWLTFYVLDTGLHLMLSANDGGYLVALFSMELAKSLINNSLPLAIYGECARGRCLESPAFLPEVPRGTADVLCVKTLEKLYDVLKLIREFNPTTLVEVDESFFCRMPETTEAEYLVKQRRGQELYRTKLIEYWEGRCAVTGLNITEILVASHIKPWKEASDSERLDVFNGFLLAPHLDSLFDKGFITFSDEGKIIFLHYLESETATLLGLHKDMHLRKTLDERHRTYLSYHRQHVFKDISMYR